MEKSLLRNTMRSKLAALSAEDRRALSVDVVKNLISLKELRVASVVGLFFPIGMEPDIRPLIRQLLFEGKTVAIPVMTPDGPGFRFATIGPLDEMEKGRYGVFEPVQKNIIEADRIDVFLVPGVAFDRKGARLGRGKGFYDRFFGETKARGLKAGVCFEIQVSGFEIPVEKHDAVMDMLVTDKMARVF